MPFKQKGGFVCVDKKILADDRFVPCNKNAQMVYERDSELYPPLYESSEADIYNLLNPKQSYFTPDDDHMMEFNSSLLKNIKDFIEKY